MWSYNTRDRSAQPPVAPPYDGIDKVRRHHQPIPGTAQQPLAEAPNSTRPRPPVENRPAKKEAHS